MQQIRICRRMCWRPMSPAAAASFGFILVSQRFNGIEPRGAQSRNDACQNTDEHRGTGEESDGNEIDFDRQSIKTIDRGRELEDFVDVVSHEAAKPQSARRSKRCADDS